MTFFKPKKDDQPFTQMPFMVNLWHKCLLFVQTTIITQMILLVVQYLDMWMSPRLGNWRFKHLSLSLSLFNDPYKLSKSRKMSILLVFTISMWYLRNITFFCKYKILTAFLLTWGEYNFLGQFTFIWSIYKNIRRQ